MTSPKLTHPKPLLAIAGFEISPIELKNTGGGVEAIEIDPALPQGLQLSVENETGVLSGRPMQRSPRADYTITAINQSGDCKIIIEITVDDAPIKTQREEIIRVNANRQDLDTPRSQVENAVGDAAHFASTIKPHEKFAHQPMGDDKRLSQQTANNENADNRAQQSPELTPSPSAQLQAQAVNAARPNMTPKPSG